MLSQDIRSKTREALADMHSFRFGSFVHINEVLSSGDEVTVKGRFCSNIFATVRDFSITFGASNSIVELKITVVKLL